MDKRNIWIIDQIKEFIHKKSLNRIDRLNRLIWNWNKKEPTYYIETMRKDLIKFKEDCQKGLLQN